VELEPGGMREMHWHPTDDEWQYVISGEGRMGGFASTGVEALPWEKRPAVR
jgi:oxalate decarboxylase